VHFISRQMTTDADLLTLRVTLMTSATAAVRATFVSSLWFGLDCKAELPAAAGSVSGGHGSAPRHRWSVTSTSAECSRAHFGADLRLAEM